jgi:hypothetical protein
LLFLLSNSRAGWRRKQKRADNDGHREFHSFSFWL